jgi:hypothetical protein
MELKLDNKRNNELKFTIIPSSFLPTTKTIFNKHRFLYFSKLVTHNAEISRILLVLLPNFCTWSFHLFQVYYMGKVFESAKKILIITIGV